MSRTTAVSRLVLSAALAACAPARPAPAEPLPAVEPELEKAAAGESAGAAPVYAPEPIVPLPQRLAPLPELVGSDVARVGLDSGALLSLDSAVWRGIRGRVSPGVALAIGRHGALVRLRGYGRLDYEGMQAATDSTLYDLASLTKVIGTTTAAMLLYDDGLLDLDARVSSYLPEFGRSPRRDSVTVRHLLTHSSGLPGWKPLYTDPNLIGKPNFYHRISLLALEYSPGAQTVYSDLGMILLQAIIERLAGQGIDDLLQERVFGPLGMTDTHYSPLQLAEATVLSSAQAGVQDGDIGAEPSLPSLEPLLARIAPTEYSQQIGGKIRGVVHDENAFAMGGVAGHAGLFSSARDLAVFAQMLLDGGLYQGRRIIEQQTVLLFTARQSDASTRALGWDTPAPNSSAGELFSARSFGHTGFTGTSLWIDPARDLFVVLLTNRVNPTRENQRHVPFRKEIHDLAQRAITDMAVIPRENVVGGSR